MNPLFLTAAAATAATLSALQPFSPSAFSAEPSARPNVILFLVDDMGYGDLAAWGNNAIRTPNLDRLVAEGVRVDHFYVASPICSPSRVGFLTGTCPQRWGITSFLDSKRFNAARGMPNFLSLKAPTLARTLHDAGYATGHFGKWHMGGQRDFGDAPNITAYGFDESLTNFEGLGDRLLPVFSKPQGPKWNGDRRSPIALMSEKLGKGKCEWVPRWEVTVRYVNRAINFIENAKKSGKNFYVNIWPDDPHGPVEPSAPYRGDGSQRTRYAGVVRELDREFGRLLDHIRNDPGLRDNTIIVFASDNGPEVNYGSSGNLRGSKGQLYEGGIRDPFVVWAPKLAAPDRIGKTNTTSVVGAIDFAPTILSIAGANPPANLRFDGHDMSDVFLGRSVAPWRPAPLCWSRPPEQVRARSENNDKGVPLPDFAIRDGKWKLLLHADKTVELYDIAADPGEMIETSADNPQVVKTLTAKLAAWQRDVKCEKIHKPTRDTSPANVRD